MFNKILVKIFSVLVLLSLLLTATLVAYGENEPAGDTPSVSTPVDSSTPESIPDQPVNNSSQVEASSVETSTEQQTTSSSEAVSTESIVSSQEQIVSSEVSSIEDGSVETTESKSSKESNTSSKKKKPSKDKGSTSKKQNTTSNSQTQSYVTSYYTPSYDAGSMSDKWEGEKTELEETSSVRELSKHLTNPKKELLKWIWLPILIALLCIGALIYINVYVYGGKHNALARKASEGYGFNDGNEFVYLDGDDEAHLDDEEDYLQKNDADDDPFSADNFFHFDEE